MTNPILNDMWLPRSRVVNIIQRAMPLPLCVRRPDPFAGSLQNSQARARPSTFSFVQTARGSQTMVNQRKVGRLPVLLLHPGGKRGEELLQHFLQGFLGQFPFLVEGVADAVQIGLGLAHDWSGYAGQDVLQSLGCADAAERPRRIGDDADRLAEER